MILKQIKPFLPLFTGILIIQAFLGIHNLKSMDVAAVRSPQKDTVLFNPDIRPTILKVLNAAHQADQAEVAVDSFILSDKAIIDLLIKIHHKNPKAVTVHLHESNAHNKKAIADLEAQGITVDKSQQHAKRISIAFKQDNENFWHRRTLTGSYNLSQRAQKNQEMMVLEANDSPAHAAHKESHVQGTKRVRKLAIDTESDKVVTQTPDKKTIIDNSTHDLHASLAPRIDNTGAGDTIYFASMNYGDDVLHTALLNAAKRGVMIHLLLDTDATTQENLKKLDELDQHKVQIVLPTAKIQTKGNETLLGKTGIQHQKCLVRVRGADSFTYISTANATAHAKDDFNVSIFYPNQDEMAQDIITKYQQLAQAGVTYQAYKASGAKLPKRKSSKKKLTLSEEDE